MKTFEGLLEKSSFWSLLGPLMLLASLTLLFVSFPEKALVFAGVALLSIALCWHWTWRGVALSMGSLAAGFIYHFSAMETWSEIFWHLGMSGALTLGFAATALASEEMRERLTKILVEPCHHQEELAEKASKIKQLEEESEKGRVAYALELDRLNSLLEAAREEVKTFTQEQETLQREIQQRRESVARVQQQMAEAREEARHLGEELKSEKDTHLELVSDFKAKLTEAKTLLEGQTRRASFLDEEKQAIQREWEREKKEAVSRQSQIDALQAQVTHFTAEKLQPLEVQLGLLQQNMAVLEAQKIAHWRAMRTAEGKALQLREQFEEKSAQLDEARRDRFAAVEQAEAYKRDFEECQLISGYVASKPLFKHIQRMERVLQASESEKEALEALVAYMIGKK